MGLKSKFKTFFLLDDEYEDNEEEKTENEVEPEPFSKPVNTHKQNVVSLQSVQKSSSKVMLVEPRVYAEAQEIADHLKKSRAVVVNLQSISHDQAKRIIDFLSGTVYAIGGDIQKIGNSIFLCTPENVEVSGNISDLLTGNEYDARWS